MTTSPDHLYDLLPAVYRIRDHEAGEPLRALLRVIAEQVDIVEADIAQIYENWFIETCQDWVVPYIADLIGYRQIHEAGEPGGVATTEERRRNKILIPRREVADTIRYRRRKGTLALLEQLAMDVAGWPSRSVEFYPMLAASASANTRRLRGGSVDIRGGERLDQLGTPFDDLPRTADIRRSGSHRTPGRYSIAGVALFVWRLKAYPLTHSPAECVDRARHHYTFSPLGNDTQLFTKTVAEPEPTHIADEMNVPTPIRRRAFDDRTEDYYGPGKSLTIWRDDREHPVPILEIVPADLSGWAYRPQGQQVAVDPELGRIVFSPRALPKTGVWTSHYYGRGDDIGGGEYERLLTTPPGRKIYPVPSTPAAEPPPPPQLEETGRRERRARRAEKPARAEGPETRYRVGETGRAEYGRIAEAIALWRQDHPDAAIIEITDSGVYVEQLEINLDVGQRLEIRAAQGCRPVIRLLDRDESRPDALCIIGNAPEGELERLARFTLNGVLVWGRGLEVRGPLAEVTIRHSTLVPGWGLRDDCEPLNEDEPSLELIDTTARIVVEHSIIGSIEVNQDRFKAEPLHISISDSVLDSTSPEIEALSMPERLIAPVYLTILRSTVFGALGAHAIELAENSIFSGNVQVAHRREGCMRFCYVPPGSRTPNRYHCQPDGATTGLDADAKAQAELRVRPQFSSMRYGTADYCRLADSCADEIKRGADDESEMGVFHDLFDAQREANLRARLAEYTPAGVDADIVFVD
ncbi:MAG: hypothetical protein ACR2M0_07980 [Chloroflexia bacterium]